MDLVRHVFGRVACGGWLAFLGLCSCRPNPAAAPDRVDIAVPYELTTLDPHAETKLSNFSVLSNVYEPLVMGDQDMRIQPCLAASWESPDPLTWMLRLRSPVTFHNGRRLRAEDVVYSLDRVRHGENLGMRSSLLDLLEVARLDDLTVQIRTRRPSRLLLNKLSAVMIVPEGVTAEALETSPDGTGPYRFAGWSKGETVRLTRNERYWGTAPPTREAEFHLNRSQDQALEGLQAGRYQLAQCDSKKAGYVLEGSKRYAVLRRSNPYVKYLAYDLAREVTPACGARPNPFRDRRVRRALELAIDRHRLVAELSNYAVPALQPVPRFVFGYNPAILEPSYDKDRARALLKEAGLEGGFEVVLHARRLLGEAASVVKEELGEIGIRVETRLLPDAEFFGALDRREASFWLSRFGCSSGDASDFFDEVAHSADPAAHLGTKNYGGYANPDLDRAIERSAGTGAPDARLRVLQEMMSRVVDELVWIPLYNDQDIYAIDTSFSWQPRSDSFIRVAEIVPRRRR